MLELFCPECHVQRAFEQPLCIDGHGADCPELCCSVCGLAVFDGPLLIAVSEARSVSSSPRAQQGSSPRAQQGDAAERSEDTRRLHAA